MRGLVFAGVLSAAVILSGCTGESLSVTTTDTHLDCAALISAANHLSVEGKLPRDPEFDRQALVSSMTHLNAYAIPANLREPEAFAQLKARRTELIETVTPESILERAKACVEKTPGRKAG